MRNHTELIIDQEAFSTLSGECGKIIDTKMRLPGAVFRRTFCRYFVVEHAHVFTDEFGLFLLKMSDIFEDTYVNYMTLDPDPVGYYHKHYSFFGLASFSPQKLIENYLSVMSRDGHVDSFRSRGGDVGVFWGSSLNWGIFCDRISWEIAVIAVSQEVDLPKISNFRCMDASWFSNYIKSQYPKDSPDAAVFIEEFLVNYPI